jgi:putative endonuclease
MAPAGAAQHMLSWLKGLFGGALAEDAGARGERLAAEWLRRERGFTVIARNWRSPRDRRDELDLVCRDGGVLVFVEVKTRAAGALVPGVHAVDARKKRVVRRAATAYLAGLGGTVRTFRFDVVEVVLAAAGAKGPGAVAEILHFENVALFPKHFRG